MSMRLINYLKVDGYSDPAMSPEMNEVTAFNITTYILNRLDDHNNAQARNHITDPDDPTELVYDPHKVWTFLLKRHNEITEDKLTAVTWALHACQILKSDTLSAYLDKYKNLIREYYYYRGQMPDTQTARMLIMSIPSLPETTVELIHATVKPLTRKGVSDYLRLYEQRHEWTSSAIREANGASASNSQKKGSDVRCTEDHCVGPHPSKECWSKPANFEKRDKFLARRRGGTTSSGPSSSHTAVRGVKKVTQPSANAAAASDSLAFHTSYEDVEASASAVQTGPSEWALHDTGAAHHMFKDRKFFVDSTFVDTEASTKRLKLAGGGVSLNVKGRGTVKLKAGDGTTFELLDCLWVPELSRNLVASGLLKAKGVRELFDDEDKTNFSLVRGNLAVFNGYIGADNLMHVELLPVSEDGSINTATCSNAESDLLHRRLGHISDQYLKTMCKHDSVESGLKGETSGGQCKICMLSKGSKIPSNHTRPRASRFLENVHVDLSGIMRVKGLRNESYYILFTDDFSSYRHIYPLITKTKEEVFEVFKSYIARAERQTGCSLKPSH